MTELDARHALRLMPLLAAALIGSVFAMPAHASTARARSTVGAIGAVDCKPGQPALARRDGIHRDSGLRAHTVKRYESDLATALAAKRVVSADASGAAARRAPVGTTVKKKVRIRVYAHVLKPSRKHVISRAKVRRQIHVMNRAYAGKQSGPAYNTHISFKLKRIDFTTKKSWYHADLGTRASKQMKASLHRGGKRDLNLYLSSPKGSFGTTLGYSTFPQQYKKHKSQDGVVVNIGSMKGGRFRGYNRGDTAVHEVGHWLGLYHTFQGGCGTRNDYVSDTAAEREPNFTCPRGQNTCSAPGLDPIHNFMDYSYDTCMNMFTKGQTERMKLHWLAYRA